MVDEIPELKYTKEIYRLFGMKLGWKTTEDFIVSSETKYSVLGKICDKYRKMLGRIGMKVGVEEKPANVDFYNTLFNVPGAFTVSKKEGGADCRES